MDDNTYNNKMREFQSLMNRITKDGRINKKDVEDLRTYLKGKVITNVFGEFFGVAALSFKDWILLVVVTCPVLSIGEMIRLLQH